ncbi:TetR/AcrR family transcriptional regulator [Cellulosimicrobium sp. CUA-896]|uniref:TetR/AcrR family transcriptional regulator n=1 Tax=Cellulosimicrobium sp. CUA-896 TaxID=1517881 RepID=UPI00095B1501|nr:TetR/AcrR family transcriptional regulator [Cellulosimicrobium sp. CUA-896]OLT47896.1 TetR family transcriptional regulator [Cellulosimicrobium sp. CUA-896]
MLDDATARTAVTAAADRLFYARGVQSVGMDAVRAEAGVSLKRIYALYPSKEDLVVAVLAGRTQQWADGLDRWAAEADTPREQVLAVFDFLDAWFREDGFRGCAFINSFGELGATSPRVAEAVREHKESFRRYVEELVQEAGLPDAVALQVVLLAEGAQTTAAITRDADVARQARAAAEALIDAAVPA